MFRKTSSTIGARGLEGVPVYVVSGLSKIAALPQMKAAWIVVTAALLGPGPHHARGLDAGKTPDSHTAQALARLEVIADTFLSMNAPVQWALPAWLAGRSAIQQQIRRRVAANLAVLDRSLNRHPAAVPTAPSEPPAPSSASPSKAAGTLSSSIPALTLDTKRFRSSLHRGSPGPSRLLFRPA